MIKTLNCSFGDAFSESVGSDMYSWCEDLFPINRSLTGAGVRETLRYLSGLVQDLQIMSIDSGERVFDWIVPEEWNIWAAYIEDESGERVIDITDNNLHVVSYSTAVDKILSLDELKLHLHTLPDQPDLIPYVTSYYEKNWGFCLSQNQLNEMPKGRYRAVIKSKHKKGSLLYGELIIPSTGRTREEIFISTYICHPSMANNELSGPVVTTALIRALQALPHRRYNYRIIFIPETIGSIVYLSRHLQDLKNNTVAGFNVTCVGDDRAYSLLPSRLGNTLSDAAARNTLGAMEPNYIEYPWTERGSDERQYCHPGIDLPVASIMRTKYGEYPEYHTSADKLGDVVTADGLLGGYAALLQTIEAIEKNFYPVSVSLGEPQLGRRGLYPQLSTLERSKSADLLLHVLTWADGRHSLIDIAEKAGCAVKDLYEPAKILLGESLITAEIRSKDEDL
jgi:aminopeptidase-like protein